MDSCDEMMIQDWHGALYKKDDTVYLCWTYSPEVTYVLEYTPSKMPDSEIIKMAESAKPIKQKRLPPLSLQIGEIATAFLL